MRRLAAVLLCVVAFFLAVPAASAHVVPTSTIRLDPGDTAMRATVSIPVSDLDAVTDDVSSYLLAHFKPTTDDGQAWTVVLNSTTVTTTGNASTTGIYQQLTARFTLTPPAGGSLKTFNLGYDAVVEKVATHMIIVTATSGGETSAVGTIRRNTVTNTVQPLHITLDGENHALTGMFALGIEHIREGTDHQLFLLALLLPAPLLARRVALRRITGITLAFTVGHSITLALGALGLPVPQQLVEALIAVSILVAAVHAIRPLFPGREALVALVFGLVHGLAFSEALRELDLHGSHLVVALLGFNLGVEAMQLIVVALVLPPLMLLPRRRYAPLRIGAAALTAVAATGWLAARLGFDNPVAQTADHLQTVALPAVALLWVYCLATASRDGRRPSSMWAKVRASARRSLPSRRAARI